MNIASPPDIMAHYRRAAESRSPQDIGNYLLIEKTELCRADMILVFGNPNIAAKSAEVAADLYHRKMAPVIVVSGGKTTVAGNIEAIEIYSKLRDLDVPEFDIIVEEHSTNTQENILHAKAQFAQICSEIEPNSLIGVGHAIAGRRFLMTIAKNWPEITLPMACNVWGQEVTGDNWHTRPDYIEKVIAQFDRIPHYLQQGFISEIDLDHINRTAKERRLTHEPA